MRSNALDSPAPPAWRRSAPVVALLLLSPVIAEVLFGATRITTIFVLAPQIGIWGCGVLIIRDVVRCRRRGWTAILLMGIALAVGEECLIQQTSLAPLVGADLNHPYGRALGVNWVYFLWALGYESIWVVVLPIQLTELIFPARRDEPWLGTRGVVISATVFVLASFVAWYSWRQVFVPRFFPELAYQVPFRSVMIALAAIVALAATALGPQWSSRPEHRTNRPAPRPWPVGLVAFGLGLPWFALVFLAYGAAPTLPPVIPLVAGLALAGVAFSLIAHVSRSPAWQDSCRLAIIFGGILASMLAGFLVLKLGGAPPIDVIGKLVLNVIAVLLLIRLAVRIQSRSKTT
ncbi:MAG: hypothetical protein ACHRXM_05070 [Isosphaerales bacterium]